MSQLEENSSSGFYQKNDFTSAEDQENGTNGFGYESILEKDIDNDFLNSESGADSKVDIKGISRYIPH